MRRLLLLALCLLVPLAASAQVYDDAPPRDNWYSCPLFRLTAFDAAQSDCMLLECGGEKMMVDGGSPPYRDALCRAIADKGISHFKYLLNTHFHDDHITGLIHLMRNGFTADAYLHPYTEKGVVTSSLQREAIRETEENGIPAVQVFHGDTLLLGEAVITLFRQDDGISTNARSMIVHVQFGDASILLPADIIGHTQSWCLEEIAPEMLDVDIVKSPHHGVTAMVSGFFKALSPELVFFTNERDRVDLAQNQADLNAVPTLYTGDGRLVLETDGKDWYVYQLADEF